MKSSYKLALVLAVVVLAVAVIYQFRQSTDRQAGANVTASPTDTGLSTVTQPRPATVTEPAKTEPKPPADLFARVQAQLDASRQAATESVAPPQPENTPPLEPATTEKPAATLTVDTPTASPIAPSRPTLTQLSQTTRPANETTSAPAPTLTTTTPTPPPTPTASVTPPPTRPVSTTPANSTYTIQAGDTFSSIAIKHYGSEHHWVDIAQANPLVDPAKLKIGQVIRLPSRADLRDAAEPGTASGPTQEATYVVRAGDTLTSIARQYYGDPDQWRVIFNANRQRIGPNPDKLQAGTRLTIPPAPRPAQ